MKMCVGQSCRHVMVPWKGGLCPLLLPWLHIDDDDGATASEGREGAQRQREAGTGAEWNNSVRGPREVPSIFTARMLHTRVARSSMHDQVATAARADPHSVFIQGMLFGWRRRGRRLSGRSNGGRGRRRRRGSSWVAVLKTLSARPISATLVRWLDSASLCPLLTILC